MGIGDRIRKRRMEKGLTLKNVAGNMVTPAQISAVERGKCRPSQGLLKYLAERLECSVEEIALSDDEQCAISFDKIMEKSQNQFNQKNYNDAMKMIDSALEMLDFINDNQKGSYYFFKGECMYIQEKYNEAFEFYTKAVMYYSRYGDRNVVCNTYKKIGNSLYNTNKFDLALGYYISAWNYINEEVDEHIVASLFCDIAICYTTLKRKEDSKKYINMCIEYCETHECKRSEKILADVNLLKGLLDMHSTGDKVGERSFNDAFEKYINQKDYIGAGRVKNNIGLCLWKMGKKKEAVRAFKEAAEHQKIHNDTRIVYTYMNLSSLFMEMGDYDSAVKAIEEAEENALKQDKLELIIEVFIEKFECFIELEEYNKAEMVGFIALDFIQKLNSKKYEAELYMNFCEMYIKLGDGKTAIDYLLKINAIYKNFPALTTCL